MKTDKVILPAFLASALINGDASGLEDEDLPWVDVAIEYCAPGHIVGCSEESFFTWSTDLPGFDLGCDALEYDILYSEEE